MTKKKTNTKVAKKKAKFDAALLVSDRVQLKDVRLAGSRCDQTPEAMSGKKTYNINHSTEVQVDRKSGYIVVIAKFHFEAFVESKAQQPVILIDASFLLSYKIENFEGLTQKGFEQFAKLNGIYNAWPYWREFIQNTIVRMGLPPLSIPVFRIVEPSGKKTVEQKGAKEKVTKKSVAKT
jgi:preprotein translocase subunit SecB